MTLWPGSQPRLVFQRGGSRPGRADERIQRLGEAHRVAGQAARISRRRSRRAGPARDRGAPTTIAGTSAFPERVTRPTPLSVAPSPTEPPLPSSAPAQRPGRAPDRHRRAQRGRLGYFPFQWTRFRVGQIRRSVPSELGTQELGNSGTRGSAGRQDPAVVGVGEGQVELAEDVGHVLLDRALGDDQGGGDGGVGRPSAISVSTSRSRGVRKESGRSRRVAPSSWVTTSGPGPCPPPPPGQRFDEVARRRPPGPSAGTRRRRHRRRQQVGGVTGLDVLGEEQNPEPGGRGGS